ncbi:hypothetical protein BH11ACT5_BH11ACT5_02670 [soil metagenome]
MKVLVGGKTFDAPDGSRVAYNREASIAYVDERDGVHLSAFTAAGSIPVPRGLHRKIKKQYFAETAETVKLSQNQGDLLYPIPSKVVDYVREGRHFRLISTPHKELHVIVGGRRMEVSTEVAAALTQKYFPTG